MLKTAQHVMAQAQIGPSSKWPKLKTAPEKNILSLFLFSFYIVNFALFLANQIFDMIQR
jgi:hypothetical protein